MLYSSDNYEMAKYYNLNITKIGSLLCQQDPTDIKEFKPKDGWTQSNEPEDHLDNVRNEICSDNRLPESILCFSYKDRTLANRLKNNARKIDYLFDRESGIIGSFPEDYGTDYIKDSLISLYSKYDLVIIRHYLEHFQLPESLLTSLKKCLRDNGLIYIEVPDCSKFILEGNPLFLWEQHLSYFTSLSITELIKECGISKFNLRTYGEDIEPSISCFCYIEKSKIRNSKDCNDNKRLVDDFYMQLIFSEYIEAWKKYFLISKRKKLILGIGHNADRFIQITNAYEHLDKIVDENINKHGKYLADLDKRITSLDKIVNISEYDFILATPDRIFTEISEKLHIKYGVNSFLSIFKKPSYVV